MSSKVMPTHYVYLDLPRDVKNKLEDLQSALEEDVGKLNLEKIDVKYAHITLGVFDLHEETKKKSLEELTEIARKISVKTIKMEPRMNIELKGLGHFGGRVLFVNIEENEKLMNLRETLMTAFEKQGMMSARDFHPHVTLFKVKKEVSVDEKRVEEMIAKASVPTFHQFPLNELYFREIRQSS